MLPKELRLKSKANIQKLLAKEQFSKNAFFVIKAELKQMKTHQFCIIISKKFKLQSVKRNKIRRQIYEIVRRNLDYLKKAQAHEIAIIVRQPALSANFDTLADKLILVLRNALRL